MKRILLLNYEFPPLGGGAGNATFYLLKELAKDSNLTIDLITSSGDVYKEEQFSDNCRIYFLNIGKSGNPQYQSNVNLLMYSVKAYFFSRKLLRINTYDLCHAFFGIPCGYIARKLGIPYIVSLRGSDIPFSNKRFYWLDRIFFKKLSICIWKQAKYVVANSSKAKNLALVSSVGQKIEVILNGVDTKIFQPITDTRRQTSPFEIVSIGRLNKIKGYQYLIEAISGLKNVRLTIAGDGNLRDELTQLAKSLQVDVHFLGKRPQTEIVEMLQNSDLFVSSSLHEGMSNAILEAMACGLPIVSTDTGGAAELVDTNGCIVKPADSTELRQAIMHYLNDKASLSAMGQRSRKIAESLSWKQAAEKYRILYD